MSLSSYENRNPGGVRYAMEDKDFRIIELENGDYTYQWREHKVTGVERPWTTHHATYTGPEGLLALEKMLKDRYESFNHNQNHLHELSRQAEKNAKNFKRVV